MVSEWLAELPVPQKLVVRAVSLLRPPRVCSRMLLLFCNNFLQCQQYLAGAPLPACTTTCAAPNAECLMVVSACVDVLLSAGNAVHADAITLSPDRLRRRSCSSRSSCTPLSNNLQHGWQACNRSSMHQQTPQSTGTQALNMMASTTASHWMATRQQL
jgi:hypothetical protein